MILDSNYHTALAEADWNHSAERVETPYGVAFRHDIFDGYTSEYDACDVLYTDIPMACGFDVFERRAGILKRNYIDFMLAMQRFIKYSNKPTVVMGGARAANFFQPLSINYKSKLNGLDVYAICFNMDLEQHENEHEILLELALRFNCIGDFCCGYGRAGRIFQSQKKRFVMSDYNDFCIGHIAEHWGNW